MSDYRMKVKVITGFLGVGKTTLLKNILSEAGPSTAVLINEFGKVGIDKSLVQSGTNIDITELPSGCICCSMRTNLVDAVKEIMERLQPERLIIEPSGVAITSGILEALNSPEIRDLILLESVVGIIDCTDFVENMEEEVYGNYFFDQMANADVILLNKIDLVSPENIEKAKSIIEEYNKYAVILPSEYCRAKLPEFNHEKEITHYHFAPKFESCVIENVRPIERQQVEKMLRAAAEGEFGRIVRAKGIYHTQDGPENFDYVQGKISFTKMKEAEQAKFVFIGWNIDRNEISKAIGD